MVVSNIFYFHPYLENISNLTKIFRFVETTNQRRSDVRSTLLRTVTYAQTVSALLSRLHSPELSLLVGYVNGFVGGYSG